MGSHLPGCNTGAADERAGLAAGQRGLCKQSVSSSIGGHFIPQFDECVEGEPGMLLSRWKLLFQNQRCWVEFISITQERLCMQAERIHWGQIPGLQQICVVKTDTILKETGERKRKNVWWKKIKESSSWGLEEVWEKHCVQKWQHWAEKCLMGSPKLHANNCSRHLLARDLGVCEKIKQWWHWDGCAGSVELYPLQSLALSCYKGERITGFYGLRKMHENFHSP